MKFPYLLLQFTLFLTVNLMSHESLQAQQIKPADYQLKDYLSDLKDKRVGVVANQTAVIDGTHLVDLLIANDVDVRYVFAPEHGFRGSADAGEVVKSDRDEKTGLPIISLYGRNKKPKKKYLEDLDYVLFDLQDVGTRFYTYISSMHYVMEACAEQDVPLMILDRPNPNGMYIDGPIRKEELKSFVGMHPIPVLHGMTMAEIAKMINGEGWLKDQIVCDLRIISMKQYTHDSKYEIPIKPSPNLPNALSIELYPTLCFFEGTVISVGRGTERPFQQIGHPKLKGIFDHHFTPESVVGAQSPPFKGEKCFGKSFSSSDQINGLKLEIIIELYNRYPDKEAFFNSFFNKLAGTYSLKNQIEAGFTADEIRISWQDDLTNFKQLRQKYLLYP